MIPILSVQKLSKTYEGGFTALSEVSLDLKKGEILALLGPNGAGKTTLISVVCGLVSPSSGTAVVGGHDIVADYRAARKMIGLVPQEVALEPFEKVHNTVRFSRGLFGKPRNDARIEEILRQLSLWDKRDEPVRALSGGMKRRVLIAKALSHDPQILFLDEPSAGVDVELRKDMWAIVRTLQEDGVTIVLTTHYIEEAEAMADRIGVINKGQILLVEEKDSLMERMGQKELRIKLAEPVTDLPKSVAAYGVRVEGDGSRLIYSYDAHDAPPRIAPLLSDLQREGLELIDVQTRQSSLEEIFVDLVKEPAA